MFNICKVIGTAALIGCVTEAGALEIPINNLSESTVSLAFSYFDSDSSKWVVEGWYNVEPKAKHMIKLNTDNGYYYLYAEFSNGNRIEGGDYSVTLDVAPTSFYYTQDEKLEGKGFSARFVRAKTDGEVAPININ